MQVQILRGLPGAGKTRYAKMFNGKVKSVSADDAHMVNGVYEYNPLNAGQAHLQCLSDFINWSSGKLGELDFLFVDNTNTLAHEIAPYYQIASAQKIDVKIVHIVCAFEDACKRNLHNVPKSTIWHMHQNLITERLPTYWRQEFIFTE